MRPGEPLKSKYLLRFDDICPTMNWEVWEQIEQVLIENDVRPILAVVPDNRDPKLVVDPPREDFWDKVRGWQARGWTIALHGWQHVYLNQADPSLGKRGKTEFRGLSRDEQFRKLRNGLEVFREQGVRADCWIAPSHSFDRNTEEILLELGVNVISDGYWRWPHIDKRGMIWIPQQIWALRPVHRLGYWTVCYHHNHWTSTVLREFASQVAIQAKDMTSVSTLLAQPIVTGPTFFDRKCAFLDTIWIHHLFSRFLRFKQWVKSLLFRNR